MKSWDKQNIFKLVFVLLLIIFGLVVQNFNNIVLPNILRDTITLSFGILYEALPFVFLGTILAVLIQSYVPSNFLIKILPKNHIAKRATLSLSGFFMPVCECGNVPLARGLMSKGLRPQDVLTFLLAAPILNPITLATTQQAFRDKPEILIIRALSAFFIANAVGWLFSTIPKKELITEDFDKFCSVHQNHKHKKTKSFTEHAKQLSSKFSEELHKLLPALIAGSVVAGIIQTVIPRTWITSLSSQPVVAIIAMIVLAFVVSICANVDAFFALSLSGIFPVSAIIAFLVFGPMIDIKMLSLLRTTYTPKALATLTLLIFLFTLTIGLGVHYVI